MAITARKKLNRMTKAEAIAEIIEWENQGQPRHPRSLGLQTLYPNVNLAAYRNKA